MFEYMLFLLLPCLTLSLFDPVVRAPDKKGLPGIIQ